VPCVECARLEVKRDRLNGEYMTAFSKMIAAIFRFIYGVYVDEKLPTKRGSTLR
jgi:hypothetical protein